MRVPVRLALAMAVFAICYLWIYRVPSLIIPAVAELQWPADLGGLGVAMTVAWFAWSRSGRAPTTVISSILRRAAAGYGIGFAAGLLSGPLLWATKPNQGLLLGFFFTGPAGAVLGGFMRSIRANSAGRVA